MVFVLNIKEIEFVINKENIKGIKEKLEKDTNNKIIIIVIKNK